MKKGEQDDRRIKILSFNCWDMKWVSKKHRIRMQALGDKLETCDYDILCFQELWVQEDFLYIQDKVRGSLPYSHFYFAGFLGSGLVIFSRWPILSTSMFPFQLNGRPAAFWRGEWYAGKGVATALIRHHTGTLIEVFNTHFHAAYGPGPDTYMCHRIAQGWSMAKLIRGAVERGRFVIAAGDLNSLADSIVHALMTQHGLVWDTWNVVHPDTPALVAESEQEQVDLFGVTCDSKLNIFSPKDVAKATGDPNPKRIDYVFTSEATVENVEVTCTELIPHLGVNYSDHFAVSVTLQLPQVIPPPKQNGHIPQDIFNNIREITFAYTLREQKGDALRCCHFFLSLAVCTSMLTGMWFVEQKGSIFVMMFFSTMCSWCGVLDGVIGYVWGRWELRSLKEFQSEMDLARRVYAQEGFQVA